VGFGGGLRFTFNLVGGGTLTAIASSSLFNGPTFLGFITDTPFNSFTMSTTANLTDNLGRPYGVEHYTLDNLQVAAPAVVPEPATLSMVGIALLGLGALRRYRRS
jgi:hypothetical protein